MTIEVYVTEEPLHVAYINSSPSVSNHGNLTGLGDDDHPQYINDTRLAEKTENDLEGVPLDTTITYDGQDRVQAITKGAVTKTLTYNVDDTLNTVSYDGITRTFAYTDGLLTGVTVTGV